MDTVTLERKKTWLPNLNLGQNKKMAQKDHEKEGGRRAARSRVSKPGVTSGEMIGCNWHKDWCGD